MKDDIETLRGFIRQAEQYGRMFGNDARAALDRLQARVARLEKEASAGWVYHNPDTGVEFHEQHPITSGMVPDATSVRPATAENLKEAVVDAWQALDEHRQAEGDWMRKCLDERSRAFDLQCKVAELEKERDSLRKALDDRFAADQRAAKAIFAETGRTEGFPSVREVVSYYIAENERLEKDRDKYKTMVMSHDLIKQSVDLHDENDSLRANLERAKVALNNILSADTIKNVCGWYPEMEAARSVLAELSADAPARQTQSA
jgi:hypothetical protein